MVSEFGFEYICTFTVILRFDMHPGTLWGNIPKLEVGTIFHGALRCSSQAHPTGVNLHMAASIPLYTSQYLAKPNVFRQYLTLDEDGIPKYEEKHHRFALFVTKIDKKTGEKCGDL